MTLKAIVGFLSGNLSSADVRGLTGAETNAIPHVTHVSHFLMTNKLSGFLLKMNGKAEQAARGSFFVLKHTITIQCPKNTDSFRNLHQRPEREGHLREWPYVFFLAVNPITKACMALRNP